MNRVGQEKYAEGGGGGGSSPGAGTKSPDDVFWIFLGDCDRTNPGEIRGSIETLAMLLVLVRNPFVFLFLLSSITGSLFLARWGQSQRGRVESKSATESQPWRWSCHATSVQRGFGFRLETQLLIGWEKNFTKEAKRERKTKELHYY